MAWTLSYYDEVFTDITDAKEWYSKQQKGLERRFAQDVKHCITRLLKNPLIYELRYKNVRVALCRTFPYAVHFIVNDVKKELIIIAIVHQHQHPDFTKNR